MNIKSSSALLFASALTTLLAPACALRTQAAGELDTSEQLLVADDDDSSDTDEALESGVDEPLSGADPSAPADPGESSESDAVMARVRTNPGKHFQPAGCIVTSVAGNVATHVFTNCTGPNGLRTFNGTVVSTWSFESGKVTVSHVAKDFQINGSTISGSRVVVYSRSGSVLSKVRTGDWSGQTAGGKAISHKANFTTTFDLSNRCRTRNGSAQSSIGNREFSRTVRNLQVCGIAYRGCPKAGGEIVLTRGDKTLEIDFLGGRAVQVTRPNGNVVSRQLACVER